MRTVKTKKELLKAIEDGEKIIKVDSKKLYAACKLAETYGNTTSLLKHYFFDKNSSPEVGVCAISGPVVVAITISVLVTAIVIIGILRDKKVKIKCKGYGIDGELEIG